MTVHKMHVVNATFLILMGFWEYFDLFSPLSFLFIGVGVVLLSFSNGILYQNKGLLKMSTVINLLGLTLIAYLAFTTINQLKITQVIRYSIVLIFMSMASVIYFRAFKK